MNSHWSDYLFSVYMDFRESPGWESILECHDAEDKKYFDMLKQAGIKNDPWPNLGMRVDEWARRDWRVWSKQAAS